MMKLRLKIVPYRWTIVPLIVLRGQRTLWRTALEAHRRLPPGTRYVKLIVNVSFDEA
jgi:hypothetical protein